MEKGSVKELQALNEIIAKRANQRFKELEKHGLESTAAYKRAKHYLQSESALSGGETFSRRKVPKLESFPATTKEGKLKQREDFINDLGNDLIEASKFLRSQTSTVSGETLRRERIFKSLTTDKVDEEGNIVKKAAVSLPEDVEVPEDFAGDRNDYFKQTFLDFLDEDVWKDIKKHLYAEDTQLLNEAGESIARGAQLQDLVDSYNAYLRNEVKDIYVVWDNWTKVK